MELLSSRNLLKASEKIFEDETSEFIFNRNKFYYTETEDDGRNAI